MVKPDDLARERARTLVDAYMNLAPGLYELRVPDHGAVTFAADGSAFIEVTLVVPPEKA